jgi:hypothetical protein
LLRKRINHGFLVLSMPVPPPSVVFDDAFNAATRFHMEPRVGDGLFAFIARKLDTRHQPQGL